MHEYVIRWIVGITCVAGLIVVFLFQRTDISYLLDMEKGYYAFFVNRTFRFLLNDIFTIGLIYGLFVHRKYVIFSLWVQLAGVVLFLIPYFIIKYKFPEYNGPLVSYLHRLILNPILLMLLIPAFYYQKSSAK